MTTTRDVTTEGATIADILEHAAHFLPAQGPLSTFVHHNTLHAFEHLDFDEAVVEAARVFGTQPYQREAAFRAHIESGRILTADLDAVVSEDLTAEEADVMIGGLISRRDLRSIRLRNLFEVPEGPTLDWHLDEGEALASVHSSVEAPRRRTLTERARRIAGHVAPGRRMGFVLRRLWAALEAATPPGELDRARVRRRDELLELGGEDVDEVVMPMLIRLAAAFLDQGVASWEMPGRDRGFLTAVRELLGARLALPEPFRRALAREFRRQTAAGESAEQTVAHALKELGVDEASRQEYIVASLLAVPGWAGMFRQFEVRPDQAPIKAVPARLVDFLAVFLTLESIAATRALARRFGRKATWSSLPASNPTPRDPRSVTYEGFVLAQRADVDLEAFEDAEVAADWIREVRSFDHLERRRLLHRAYERRLNVAFLDGIAAHDPPADLNGVPSFQAVFCIDERECSTRRHLEESHPDAETFGYAGFFGVAMAWQGLADVRPSPLCPVNVTPTHYVTERPLSAEETERWRATLKRRGFAMSALTTGSRRAFTGALSSWLGLWSMIPMVGRCLFPRLAHHWAGRSIEPPHHAPETRLTLWRNGDERDEAGRLVGYSFEEAADVVEGMLRTIGLTDRFSKVVAIVGHGSSSLNNPHESAHDCGATGGGRGGPNARAFAEMANRQEVRAILRERGIEIPASTWFVGAYHNTCDDSIRCFDEDLIPAGHGQAVAQVVAALDDCCALDAHERCRRFASANPGNDVAAARRAVEERSVDLAQPRPEYGHATNAYAIVGRRARTRGLFLDRRAFLVSYDPTTDPDGGLLARLLAAVVPVGAGINLEYYFSFVDPTGYGCGTKLPHNITGLIGVMDGHRSDLRTGLPWQMVEIHEPVRLHCVVEAEPDFLLGLFAAHPELAGFVDRGWILLSALSPESRQLWTYQDGGFHSYEPELRRLPVVSNSAEFYRDEAGHLGLATIRGPREHADVRSEPDHAARQPTEVMR